VQRNVNKVWEITTTRIDSQAATANKGVRVLVFDHGVSAVYPTLL